MAPEIPARLPGLAEVNWFLRALTRESAPCYEFPPDHNILLRAGLIDTILVAAMRRTLCLASLAVMMLAARQVWSADMLHWDTSTDHVDAQIETWTVPQLLQRVAAVTGWQVFIDPAISNSVPTKFKEKKTGDALQRLLGSINYALAPDTNGAPRLYVFRNSRDQATQAVAPIPTQVAKAKGRIENEVVVTLKPGEKIEDLAKKLGAKIVGRVDGLNTYRLRFDDADAAQAARQSLGSNPAVASVDDNFFVQHPESSQPLGGPGRPLGLNPKAVPDGKYVVVGLIDTAVQGKEGNVSDFLLPSQSVAGEAKPSDSGPTHGTSMSETILRGLSYANGNASTAVRILPVDVYGGNPNTSTFDVASGIYQAVNSGASIINLSLGSDGDSAFLHNTIVNAHNQGVVFLAAAGNEPVTTPTYPAAYSEVIAVTASDRQGNIASYANRGSFVDVVAPGQSFVTFAGEQFYVIGTSASTAYASGVAAAAAETSKANGGSIEAAVRQAFTPKKTSP